MDGRKNMQALRRLLARVSNLNENPTMVALLSKGSTVTNEDIINVCQELFLRPELTLVIAGCFRHLLPWIVKSLVDNLCESYAHRTLTESTDKLSECLISTSSWNLCIHEHIVVAFSRVLELAPHVLSSVIQYFLFAPPPFERLLQGRTYADQPNWKSQPSLLDVVRASYRFILLEPSSFESLWDWSPFIDLLLFEGTEENDVRWCAVQIISLVNKLSDEATRAVSLKISCLTDETAFSCLLRWEEFCYEVAVEKGGWFVEPSADMEALSVDSKLLDEQEQTINWKWDMSGRITHVDVCGVELLLRKSMKGTANCPPSLGKSRLPTATLKGKLKALALALSQKEPILLEGPAGSGKTTIIQQLGELTGNIDAVFIHLNEQVDGKTLLGTYVCTEVPGEFRWQPGAITQAVLQGLWLVLEDVDKAPSEVLSALVPLLETRRIYIPGRAETMKAAANFQLFATVTRTDRASASCSRGRGFLNNLWRRVVIVPPNDSELGSIIGVLFPALRSLVPKILETFKSVDSFASQALSAVDPSTRRILFGRCFSTRDLFKWCKRLKNMKDIGPSVQPRSVREMIYTEAVDCFAGCISDCKSRRVVINAIAKLWDIAEEQVNFFEVLNKPTLQIIPGAVQVGRAFLPLGQPKEQKMSGRPFAYTGHSMRNLERIAVCVQQHEAVLLVGETGTGKTTLVQHLAEQVAMPLIVMNLSQQTDSADFIGGFKPVEAQHVCMNLLERFKDLFCGTFPSQHNSEFLARIHQFAEKRKFKQLLKAFGTAVVKVESLTRFSPTNDAEVGVAALALDEPKSKRKRRLTSQLMDEWDKFSLELGRCERQVLAAENTFAFSFIEGAFVRAFKDGHWILLDELNLAPVETLERLTGVLEGENGSLNLTERGDIKSIPRHPNFRLFGCMNPATDVGKHDLPSSLKNRFTEFYVDEITGLDDLQLFVFRYLEGLLPNPPVAAIVDFYQRAQQEAETRLYDSANQKPRYSLRSLARALEYTQVAMPVYGFARALFDGVCMTFLTLLDRPSSALMENLIQSHLMRNIGFDMKQKNLLARAPGKPSDTYVEFEHFWLEKGDFKPSDSSLDFTRRYVLTKTVKEHLKHVAKAVFIRKYPVLLQGPTSSGKTSSIEYLATVTGHRFVRINNHEHTDLQEYLGTYVTSPSGKLVFQEGILVEAVRNGYWVVLDELNLAPSEVLEALNRLLDDNRELFVPELQIVVKPHPHFMLFATQNPPGLYGGRKVLSRAFRNRFLELHVDDIPEDELCIILEKRCELPRSYAEKMVAVMKDLQRNRQTSQAFAGKHGFITARDLFKWADRHRKSGVSYEDLARIGYVLLAERLRDANEKWIVCACLEKNLRTKIRTDTIYSELATGSDMKLLKEHFASKAGAAGFENIVWTKSMTRLFSLVEHCYEHKEPMLLIGETGCGKTTVCQLLAVIHGCRLRILNCHQHTETADFLGGFRPVRDRESIVTQFEQIVCKINSCKLFGAYQSGKLPHSIESAEDTIRIVHRVIEMAKASGHFHEVQKEVLGLDEALQELERLRAESQALFLWQDGPLVETMRRGDFFLVDEISLADDSVLERLNSVLEPKRLLVLAEKGGSNVEELLAHPDFLLMATMNPGGDFGKKELSPALRNRFTEIWVPPITEEDDIRSIVCERFLDPQVAVLIDPLLNFWKWFGEQHSGRSLTVRDLLSWIIFVNSVKGEMGVYSSFIHGAYLVLLDGISLGTGLSDESASSLRKNCLDFLLQQLPLDQQLVKADFDDKTMMRGKALKFLEDKVGVDPFFISKGPAKPKELTFELMAPTTSVNMFRILRAMQLPKPVLIEGSPGVGKTSLITALANISGHSLVRINLSEQTDMMDLLGSDLPSEGADGADFRWSDGVFLQALKVGSWVLLDELNLASQSVLEGLNACLDHRGEVFIPELGCSFKCHPSFRIFGCQNPSLQGGGRKSLPRSFLNRFTKVYVDTLSEEDFLFIASSLYPSISAAFLQKLICFNTRILKDTMVARSYGHLGAPWEFNLRDVLRSCALLEGNDASNLVFLEVVYLQRMRTARDRFCVLKLYEEVFGTPARLEAYPCISVDPECLKIGNAALQRFAGPQSWSYKEALTLLPGQFKCLEALLLCVKHGWMSILVGPAGCGKTSLVRLLSKLMGTTLQEFSLSSGTDTTDLLGCFEQYDVLRYWQQLVKRVGYLVHMVFGCCVIAFDKTVLANKFISFLQKMLVEWSFFEKSCILRSENNPGIDCKWNFESNVSSSELDLLARVVDQVKFLSSMSEEVFVNLRSEIEGIEKDLQALMMNVSSKIKTSHFEWVDGGFLRAVERGDWVLLENANMCSPTVLDRLNPLLEPSGAILVNERGLTNGTPTVLRAHPNFRLFLTVDPCQGEVSRAMRNRGVEIHVMQPHAWIDSANYFMVDEDTMKNARDPWQYLIHTGIPSASLVTAMHNAHTSFSKIADNSEMEYTANLRELRQWVCLFWQLFDRGSPLSESLYCSWDQLYLQGCDDSKERGAIANACSSHFHHLTSASMVCSSSTLQVPGGWPRPLSIDHLCRMSNEAGAMRDCMYVRDLLGEQVAHHIRSAWYHANGNERRNLFKWMQNQKELAVMLPPRLFQLLLHPASPESLVLTEGTDPGVLILDRKVMYASFWMMRYICNALLRDMRFAWMRSQAAKVGLYCNSLVLFCKILWTESEHPVFKQTLAELDTCRAVSDACMEKLDALRRTLLQWQIEDDMFGNADQKAHSKADCLIMKSYKCYEGQLKNNAVEMDWNDPALEVYPLLLFIRGLQEELLSSRLSLWKSETYKGYLKLLDSHEVLWKAACEINMKGNFNSQSHGLYLCWKGLRVNTFCLGSLITSEKVASKFMQTVQSIDKAFLKKKAALKLYLWKDSGHPRMPRSKEAFEQLQALFMFCDSLWPNNIHGEGDVRPVSSNEVFRRLVLEGISMSVYALWGLWNEEEDAAMQRNGHLEKGIGVAGDILQKLYERLNSEKLQKTFPNINLGLPGCTCSPLHLLHDPYYHEELSLGCKQSLNSLVLPWLDSLSLLQDRTTVATVTELAARLICNVGHNVSSRELVDAKEELLGVIEFTLKFSSRSPLDLVPHQHILWLIKARTDKENLDGTFSKEFRTSAHQLCFNWYKAAFRREPSDDLGQISAVGAANTGASWLFDASNSATISHAISQIVPLKQFHDKVKELRLASKVLWGLRKARVQNSSETDFLHASATVCQLICSFSKSFERNDAAQLQSLLFSLHRKAVQGHKSYLEVEVQQLKLLLTKSSDKGFVKMVNSHIGHALDLLYSQHSQESLSTGFNSLLGRVWLLVGATRLNLVLPSEAYDPSAKYDFKHSALLEKHSDARLELQVRQESDLLVRGGSTTERYWDLQSRIEEMEGEIKATALKCVYRQRAENLELFYNKVKGFIKSMDGFGKVLAWITDFREIETKKHSIDQMTRELQQWQEVSMEFIQGILLNYPDYQDLAQPVLLSVFQMKLGLTLLSSAFRQKNLLRQRGFNGLASSLCSFVRGFMEFPTRNTFIGTTFGDPMTEAGVPVLYLLKEGFIESMVSVLGMEEQGKEILHLKVKIFKCAILTAKTRLLQGGLAYGNFQEIVRKLLALVSVFWRETRDRLDAKRVEEVASIKIKHESHSMGLDLDQDEDSFRTYFPEHYGTIGSPAEDSEELERSVAKAAPLTPVSEQDWKAYESMLGKELIDLLQAISSLQSASEGDGVVKTVSDDERLGIFVLSYDIGKRFLEGVGALLPSSLNETLVSAHLLMLSLKQESFRSTKERLKNFNIYEDASPSELAPLLNFLESLQEHIMKLLGEWPDQPSLVQLMRGLDALLSMPIDVPLVKALTGVEQLLAKAQLWEENAPKHLSLQDFLAPLQYLVSRWRKLELEYWEVLLQKVEFQFDLEADKLWFPLYGVLHPIAKIGDGAHLEPTIASLEELMQTASLGEYKRRLQMLTGFYGEICTQSHLSGSPTDSSSSSNLIGKVLYNVSIYYSQFLPLVEDAITIARNGVANELKDFLKLHKWDERNYYALTSSTENTHRKLFKFVSRYKVLLGKPALATVISRNQLWGSVYDKSGLENQQKPCNKKTKGEEDPNSVDCESTTIHSNKSWQSCLTTKVQDLVIHASSYSGQDTVGLSMDLPSLLPRFWRLLNMSALSEQVTQARQRGTDVLEDLATTVVLRSNELREVEKKRSVKKRALVDLLKALRALGFSHHRSAIPKEERSPKAWILQPACNVDCLLNLFMKVSGDVGDGAGASGLALRRLQDVSCLWSKACDYYFKNLALLQQLRQLSLNFHKDLTLQEVTASTAYMEHGLFIQQRQRRFIYNFASSLVNLQNIVCNLGTFVGVCSSNAFGDLDVKSISNQPAFERKWLWLQKGLLDSLHNTCLETLLFYKMAVSVESCPSDKRLSGLAAVVIELEKLAVSLSSCKKNLDELLVPGIKLFSAHDLESSWPVLITQNAKQMISESFSVLSNAKSSVEDLFGQMTHGSSGLYSLWELCCQALKLSEDYKELCKKSSKNVKIDFFTARQAYEKQWNQLISEVLLSVQALTRVSGEIKTQPVSNEFLGQVDDKEGLVIESQTVLSWTHFMEEQMSALRLEKVYEAAVATFLVGVKQSDNQQKLCKDFFVINEILELLIAAGIAVFADYVSLHKSLSKLSYILGNLFEALFQEGFCKMQDEAEHDGSTKFEEAGGTGMGEGQGKTDVSHQIEDEDQLLGSSGKGPEEKGSSEDKDLSGEKGIEMSEDFEGDLMDISQNQSDGSDEDDEEGSQVESKMGAADDNEEIIDERLWSKDDEEEIGHDGIEKYEAGSFVQERSSDLEFRAKENDEGGSDDQCKEEQSQQDSKVSAETEEVEEHLGNTLNKNEAYEAPTGIEPSADSPVEEKTSELDDADATEDLPFDDQNQSLDKNDVDEDVSETQEAVREEHEPCNMTLDDGIDADAEEASEEKRVEEFSEGKQETHTNQTLEHVSNQISEKGLPQGVGATDLADPSCPQKTSSDMSMQPCTTSMDVPSIEEVPSEPSSRSNLMSSDSDMGLSSGSHQHRQTARSNLDGKEDGEYRLDRLDANPYRSLGDVLKEWKERVTVKDERALEAGGIESPNEDLELEGSEYQYVTEDKDFGPQALGSATLDQMNQNKVNHLDFDKDVLNGEVRAPCPDTDMQEEMEAMKSVDEIFHKSIRNKSAEKHQDDNLGLKPGDVDASIDLQMQDALSDHEEVHTGVESHVSTKSIQSMNENSATEMLSNASPYNLQDIQRIRKELEFALNMDLDNLNKARSLWEMYEQLTTRLSQELTEQLRLIMEPSLAARLEGDYRTGKRINLKKVIPYIASQFRRDKIWLRRTKPSKRQYQVVLAIDDSRSMSESHCGHLALEALITICRSMSTLEVGQMAVASFGQKGNVKILHDFDSPFTTEAGIRIISQFSFRQDNTIADEPMVDLLQYLTWMLEVFAKSPSTSDRNQLQQLILIIADGRFHEKETLRRCIREAVSRGQMLAFIVLDNTRQSIMDVQSVSFTGGAPTFSKYIDTFPFPYYILLKNIEELPRTLVDLLRQWFEMVQRAKSQ